ncbi:MAG: hypothetical protein Q9166_003293 [cf. Caloplaca sp. 2 TL-2023]
MTDEVMNRAVNGVQNIIGYRFNNLLLVWEALQAAGCVAQRQDFPDGNKRLAVLGDIVLDLALAESWYASGEPRATFNDIRQRIGANVNLDRRGLYAGLAQFVNLAPGMLGVSPITMTATVEAILGAVYLESNMQCVGAVMRTLNLV